MPGEVRVRFAPSPTGLPHIGNIRTALFNWLFARHHGGKFIVRVEDTDQARLVPGSIEAMLDGLRWLNIDWDEGPEVDGPYGPYFQSERLEIYHELAERLVSQGNAYHCYCSQKPPAEDDQRQRDRSVSASADCQCRDLTQADIAKLSGGGESKVVRFAMPKEGVTSVDDLIRGEVEWRNETLNDFIIMKSDGFPTYHLAVVADDYLMEISHIMRAEEWLPSTPRHVQLFKALGFEPPKFAHLPMIMGPDRAKLSKRHGATAIGEYKEDGILPEALLNFMVLLGWSLDDKTDVVAPQTVIDNFTLDRITKSSAIFDQDKLQWMNGMYIRELTTEQLANQMMPFLQQGLPKDSLPVDEEYLRQIAPLLQQRMKNLKESADSTSYFFQADEQFDTGTLVQKGMDRDSTLSALKAALADLSEADNFQHEKLEEMLTTTGERLELSRRQFFGVLRVAATGRAVSPPLFEMMEVLGKDRTVSRVRNAIERFSIPS
ncbi:MAG: glutamate--tRNA ligase [SAR202 cluster bacterium]|nr:glutamate--tRNA ligase [Dehalococcoidia bacterium]MQG13895.1 glutamate--tRNA ligase [SAR202 cluster bacterium]MQG45159.1 glutamate--tRNA ligase [SAR202 cluster bacterium]